MNEAVETEMAGNFKIEIFRDDDPMSPREWGNLGHMVSWHDKYNLGDEFRKDSQVEFLQELAEAVNDSVAERIYYWENGNGHSILYKQYIEALAIYEKKYSETDDVLILAALEKPQDQWAMIREKVMAIIYKTVLEHYIMLPLGLYDHSGITMYVGSRSPFDSDGWDSGQVGWIYVTKKKVREEYGWKNLSKKRIETIEGYLRGEVEAYDRLLTGRIYGFRVTEHGVCKHCGIALEADIDSCWGHFIEPSELLEDVKEEVKHYESDLGDCECYRYKQLLKAIGQEEIFNGADSERETASLAGRLDARMGIGGLA